MTIKHPDYRIYYDPATGHMTGAKGKRIGTINPNGYETVTGYSGGKSKTQYSHRVAWECVNGPIPRGLDINHINGNKLDNRIVNLELVTRSENLLHARRTGLRQTTSLLTAEQIEIVQRSLHIPGVRLAREFGVSEATISKYRNRRTAA